MKSKTFVVHTKKVARLYHWLGYSTRFDCTRPVRCHSDAYRFVKSPIDELTQVTQSKAKLEAGVGIDRFSPQLRDKNAHFSEEININLVNQTKLILTGWCPFWCPRH